MNSKSYINHLIQGAEDCYNNFNEDNDVPFPCITILKSDVKKYNIEELKLIAKQEGYVFTDMLYAPKPLNTFPESYRQERYLLYKEI